MSWKLVTALTDADRRLLTRAVEGFVPEKVYDIHTHLFHTRHFAEGKRPVFLDENRGYGLTDFNEACARWLPWRQVEGLFFGYPSVGNDRDGENAWMQEQVAPVVKSSNSRALVLAAPDDDPAAVRRLLEGGVFVGIKCYRLYANVEDTRQATIESFTPEWMWQLCDEFEGVLMLHIMRDDGITDPHNIETLRRLCRRYPKCRLVLAHVARSFNYRHAREGLRAIVDLDNVVVDTSAVTQTGAFRAALEVLGPQRVLWGSDYMVSELRGACFTQGDGFTWVYADDAASKDLTVFGHYTLVGIESLLCLREACEDTGMSAGDIQDIFRDNALRLLAPHLPQSSAPAAITGPQKWQEAREKISCGTGLMSKRAESFDPISWPAYFSRCSGPYIWDLNGRRLTDFTGGVGAILLGHSDPEVNAAVHRRVNLGTYCTLNPPDEVELADVLLELHPWAQRVRYARGGGEALSLAVRIARAATGRSGVAFCGYHGWSDWYLAANLASNSALDGHLIPGLEPHGVPRELAGTSVPFKYNDLGAFESAMAQLDGRLAAVVMEPFRSELPRDGFVEKVAAKCRAAGAVFVVDEVTAGWRFGMPGGSAKLGIEPDLAVYAKATSNGIPCGAVVGRGAVMDAANTSFISSSYWTDGIGPAAALACIRKMLRTGTQPYVESLGEKLHTLLSDLRARHPSLKLTIGNRPCAPSLTFALGEASLPAKALMIRKMLARGFLMSSQLYVMHAHDETHVAAMIEALDEVLAELSALHDSGRLLTEAGRVAPAQGFTRLA
ncbi:aminotransferase class III-fold pyridoxal phosphate-dependent enzyme [Roseimicrobium sp. ORNL1]|uniref:aminotransferase class III-fold pyridoxal phosphate-dependent enzyme n=1 Tax=Roseimicrobium sp. ORNL1 TaxID=2711231 RepID=UPI0013E134B9|nr:aminotransferase class III-fold pyridoxal phosphate-dependent enzyme [Roseimicrobium sp. ORNL1]QIF00273.1 aminotransferase class III-fold pyridoxal phosphate-dependent enzyme [Roseimicrobium sp. ORNL1]